MEGFLRSDLDCIEGMSENVAMCRLLENVGNIALFMKSLCGTCCAAFYLWLIPAALGAATPTERCDAKTSAVRGVQSANT